jgi:predicted dehydrogenase
MKVIILGAGGRGNVYSKLCTEFGVEVVGLADPDSSRLQKVAKEYTCTLNGQRFWRSLNLPTRLSTRRLTFCITNPL